MIFLKLQNVGIFSSSYRLIKFLWSRYYFGVLVLFCTKTEQIEILLDYDYARGNNHIIGHSNNTTVRKQTHYHSCLNSGVNLFTRLGD